MSNNAFTPNNLLALDSSITLRDWQHAARLFTDDQFRLAPKSKFTFHVAFNLNKKALIDKELSTIHNNEINMLVKSASLPTYTVVTEILNQYNRKKVIQYTHKFEEIEIVFNDDNMNLINTLWQNYYKYYYADSKSADINGAYNKTAMKNYDYINTTYGLDNGSNNPFFNYITIYQMARHEYISYKLINPIITSFNHNKLSYSDTNPHDFNMKIAYESVAYGNGLVNSGDIEGFGTEHYDLSPSPLQPGGINDISNSSPTFINKYKPDLGMINTLIQQVTNVNTKNKIMAGTSGIITNNIGGDISTTLNGIQGFSFPMVQNINNVITANKVNL